MLEKKATDDRHKRDDVASTAMHVGAQGARRALAALMNKSHLYAVRVWAERVDRFEPVHGRGHVRHPAVTQPCVLRGSGEVSRAATCTGHHSNATSIGYPEAWPACISTVRTHCGESFMDAVSAVAKCHSPQTMRGSSGDRLQSCCCHRTVHLPSLTNHSSSSLSNEDCRDLVTCSPCRQKSHNAVLQPHLHLALDPSPR